MTFDFRHYRTALGWFATGVTIITARSSAGDLIGITANRSEERRVGKECRL